MKAYPITVLCAVMRVGRSGFYDSPHSRRQPEDRPEEQRLKARIRAIFRLSHGSYGSRGMVRQPRLDNLGVGRCKLRRLMRQSGLKAKRRRRFKVTTESRHLFPKANNILNRRFDAKQPDKVWAAEITCVRTLGGGLYLAVAMNLYSRRIVGWAADKRIQGS